MISEFLIYKLAANLIFKTNVVLRSWNLINWTLLSMAIAERENPSLTISQLAFGDGTPKKAALTALLVGTILTAINHGDMILDGITPDIWKVVLTYCVPYCVTTWGAATGKLAQWRRNNVTH